MQDKPVGPILFIHRHPNGFCLTKNIDLKTFEHECKFLGPFNHVRFQHSAWPAWNITDMLKQTINSIRVLGSLNNMKRLLSLPSFELVRKKKLNRTKTSAQGC